MKKILVIDDDQFFSKTLEGALPAEKYILISAEDGEVGLEKLKSELEKTKTDLEKLKTDLKTNKNSKGAKGEK